MRVDGWNHHQKLGLKRISCGSQFTILDMADTSPNPVGNYMDMRSNPNQASCTPDIAYPLISSISFSSSSPICLFLVYNSTIIVEYIAKSSLSISPYHYHELTLEYSITPSAAYTECSMHRVQHAPSAACTKCSIHQVQHTLSAAYTECSIHWVQHTLSTA